MTALVLVFVLSIVNVLMDMHLAVMLMCVFMLIIGMATHFDSPPSNLSILFISRTRYLILSVAFFLFFAAF